MPKNRCIKICAITLMLLVPEAAAIIINEVMYNPVGDDNNREFVEVFGTGNLSGYMFGDLISNDSLVLLKYVPGSYSLIVEDDFDHSGLNCSVYSAGSTIGNNLNNGNETIFLYINGELIDSMSYDGSLADSNNRSLELVDGNWQESCAGWGSPCTPNCPQIVNETINESINETMNISINATVNGTANLTVNTTINITINDTIINNTSVNDTIINSTIINDANSTGNITNITDSTASDETKQGFRIEAIVPGQVMIGIDYDSLFRITNLNYSSGSGILASATVYYNVTRDGSAVISGSFTKSVNHYVTSDTGIIVLDETGNYTICGAILDTPLYSCKDFSAVDPLSVPCFIRINISTDKMVYENKESVQLTSALNNESHEFIIEYWVEDLFGGLKKKKLNTTTLSKKSFTPSIDEHDLALVAKARLASVACNNTNNVTESESVFIVKNSAWQPREEEECSCPSAAKKAASSALSFESTKPIEAKAAKAEASKIVSFYTRTKKWHENITLYANIELGDSDKEGRSAELILKGNGEEQQLQVRGSGTLSFDVGAEPGINTFTLDLLSDGESLETRVLIVNLSIEEKELKAEESPLTGPGKAGDAPEQNYSKALAPVTGSVVYESSNKRLAGYAPYILVFVMLIAIIALSLLKKK